MKSVFDERLESLRRAPFGTGAVPAHGIANPISDLLAEYYRRMTRLGAPLSTILPPTPEAVRAWAGKLASKDAERVEEGLTRLVEQLDKERIHVPWITMAGLVRAILSWSLLVDHKELSLDDDPSVPLLRIFAAGYSLKWVSHGLEIWGELPWTINPGDVLRRAGLWT